MVAEILDLIARRIETDLVPRPARAALLDKAAWLLIERWIALHSEDRAAVDEVRSKHSGPKKVVRLTKARSAAENSRAVGRRSEGEETL